MTSHRRVLYLALTNDVGANRVVGAMANAGLDCAVLSPPDFYSARSGMISRHFPLPRQRGLWLAMLAVTGALERTIADWAPDWIVPLDDMASWQLRSLVVGRRASAALHRLIVRSLGSEHGYCAALSRTKLLDLAAASGVRVPQNIAVRDTSEAIQAATAIGYPLMFKLEHTCGGAGVFAIRNPAELKSAMTSVGLDGAPSLQRLRTAAKQLVWSRANLVGLEQPAAAIQSRVEGRLAIHTVAAVEGRILDGVTFSAVAVHPEPAGASTVLRPIDHPEMAAAAVTLVSATEISGFASFDFLIAPDNSATLIEMNARPVGSVHLGSRLGHDVCGAMAAHIKGHRLPPQNHDPMPDMEIALFPKELERDPCSPRLAAGSGCHHDIPWEDMPVIAAYLEGLAKLHPTRMAEIRAQLRQQPPTPTAKADTKSTRSKLVDA